MKTLSFGNKLAFLSQFYFHVLDDDTKKKKTNTHEIIRRVIGILVWNIRLLLEVNRKS